MNTGTSSTRANLSSPVTWSQCSCVMRIALSDRGSCPAALRRLKVSRAEIPASTRIRVELEEMSAVLPRLPLASTVKLTHMREAYREQLWKREYLCSTFSAAGHTKGPSERRRLNKQQLRCASPKVVDDTAAKRASISSH